MKVGTGDVHINLFSDGEFRENWRSESYFYGRNESAHVFRIDCPMWVKFGTKELLVSLLSTGEIRENRL
jgi:hypothetical protein